jgi:hypothetical protein
MDTKAFSLAVQYGARGPNTTGISQAYAVQSARWWPLILLFSAFCVISGCQRKIPEPGEPMIEQHDETAAPGDGIENDDGKPRRYANQR